MIWSNQNISRSLKVTIYQALILPIAAYGAESWTLRKSDMLQLEAFEMRYLRSILGVRLLDKIRNMDIRSRLKITKKQTPKTCKVIKSARVYSTFLLQNHTDCGEW